MYFFFVAVDTATRKERSDFLTEIEMMKKISEGYNNHIVNLVGCVTIQEPLCLITEFVPHGDLLDYLRNQRKKVLYIVAILLAYDSRDKYRIIQLLILQEGESDIFHYFCTIFYVQFRNSREGKSTSGVGNPWTVYTILSSVLHAKFWY